MARNPEKLTNRLGVYSAWAGMSLLVGCGGGEPAATVQAPAPAGNTAVVATSAETPSTSPPTAAIDPKRLETKWIGTIPYDVFYDRPWEVAADRTVLGGTQPTSLTSDTPPAAGEKLAGGEMPTPAGNLPPKGVAAVDWEQVVPLDSLVGEIKVVRARLANNLQSLKNYNAEYKWISTDGTYLAMLAGVVEQHPSPVNWQANARFVRELGIKISSSATTTGRSAFETTQLAYEQLCVVIDGGQPPEIEAQEMLPFGEYAYLAELMKWLEPAFNAVKANINTEAKLKEDPEGIERQLRALLLVGRVMGTDSYDYAAEDKYQGFIQDYVTGAEAAIQGLKSRDFAAFQAGLGKVQTSCSECHPIYRGASGGF